jgi:prepilin-type N-terminal cleavage/methylation domain-containing protein
MKKQTGFTLIELLLVLAIIGIISAIAIPALLGQRARARDKSGIANADGILADFIGGYDKVKDTGSAPADATAFIAAIIGTSTAPILPQFFSTQNPWQTTGALPGYATTIAETATTGAAVKAAVSATKLGQVATGYMAPAAGANGCVSAAVWVNTKIADGQGGSTNVYYRVNGVD